MSRSITIEHNGSEYGGQIGTIKATGLGYEDHGILTASLVIDWPGGGVSAGGYCLDSPDRSTTPSTRIGTAYGLDHIIQIMRTVGIASTTDENRVLVFKEHADKWREAEGK